MNPPAARPFSAHWFALLFVVLSPMLADSEPFVPRDGSQVLETLRTTAFDAKAREIRELRARLAADPGNAALACQLARRCIERSRSDADPRYLGRAQAALGPWWDAAHPPVDVLVLRATIKQSQHDFTNALADLDLALKLEPRNAQVWLTRATILIVLGDYAGARRSCLPLAQLAPGLVALTAAVSVASLNGEAESGCRLLHSAFERNPTATVAEKVWALTVLGEALARLGRMTEAEDDFKKGLALSPRDPYLLGAYADLLLDQARAQEAVRLLQDQSRADGLLLRLALAEAALVPRPVDCDARIGSLTARFEAGNLRGDFVHQREEARFRLHLLNRPREALRLAQANWRIQHEPADVRILLETAVASGDSKAAEPALDFIRTNRLEDVEMAKLATQLQNK